MATVQIVMAVYNGEKYLVEQLESLRAQTFADWELLISDDCSTDASLSIIKRYCETDKRIKLVLEGRRYGGAKQHFMALLGLADAPYVMTCDQDDVWDMDKVKITLNEMRAHEVDSKPVLVCTDLRVVDEKLNLIAASFRCYSYIDTSDLSLGFFLASNLVAGCTMMVNQGLLNLLHEEVNPNNIFMHDWWAALLASAFGEVVFIDRATISYRQHGNNSMGATKFSFSKVLSQVAAKREIERLAVVQAGELFHVFNKRLSPAERAQVIAFASIKDANPIKRIWLLSRAGAWRRGLLRNVASLFAFLTLYVE